VTPPAPLAPPEPAIGGACGIGAGSLLTAGGVLTAAAVELDIRVGLDFLATVADHRTMWVLAAVCIAVAQPLLAPLLAAAWSAHPGRTPWTAVAVGLWAAAAVLQLTSAVVNVPLGASVAGHDVARSDAALGTALHDVADGLFFVANALAGLGALALAAGWPSHWLRVLAVVAAVANLAVFAGFAVEALWPLGVVGYFAVAAFLVTVGILLARRSQA
jgi:hypothetical protein